MSRDSNSGRWDAERLVRERERERDRFEERLEEMRQPPRASGALVPRPRERSVDETYERRIGPGGRVYEDEHYQERDYYDEPRQSFRPRRESVTFEKESEREVYSPRRVSVAPRPGLLRRQSSLDTFDRRPVPRYEREDFGPAPRVRAPVPLQRRYVERDYEEAKISNNDGPYRPFPERVVEREIVRSRRRSLSREPRGRSLSSSSSSSSEVSVRKEFPKRGKTRMPSRLGDVVVIQKALGPENIDEVIKLSEIYKRSEKKFEPTMSGGRGDDGGEIIQEHREVVRDIPAQRGYGEIIEKTTYNRRELMRPPLYHGRSHSAGPAPRIIDAHPAEYVERSAEYVERSNRNDPGPMILYEKKYPTEIEDRTTLRVEPNRAIELKRGEIVRREGRTELIVLEEGSKVRRRRHSTSERAEVRRDKKAAQARALATMMKTLT